MSFAGLRHFRKRHFYFRYIFHRFAQVLSYLLYRGNHLTRNPASARIETSQLYKAGLFRLDTIALSRLTAGGI